MLAFVVQCRSESWVWRTNLAMASPHPSGGKRAADVLAPLRPNNPHWSEQMGVARQSVNQEQQEAGSSPFGDMSSQAHDDRVGD